jgi:nucleoside-triphosphatase THEP1
MTSISAQGNLLVVTGWRGVGKTTFCQQAVDEYRKAGLKVSGLLSPARFDQKQKTGFFAHDLDSDEIRLAASVVPGEIDGLRLGSWTFDPEIFAWGNRCLKQAVGLDVLVIDELGPLEFDLQTGWTASFEVLRRKRYRLALIVIRPECLDAFSNMGFVFQTKEITTSKE